MLDPADLTPERLHPSRLIAKGRRIREVDRLIQMYGGQASRWTKRAGPTFSRPGRVYEIHWYEHHGIGSFEHKLVQKNGPTQ